MSYLTQCPACGTVFRLRPEHLDARQGFVRCGQCSKVFDARATLAEEAEPVAVSVENEVEVESAPVPAEVESEPVQAEVESEPVQAEVESEPHTSAVPAVDAARKESAPPLEVTAPEQTYSLADVPTEEAFDFGPERRRRARLHAIAWGIGSFVLLVLLGAQGAWFYRTDLAVRVPESKPWLEALCVRLGCQVPPPQQAALLSIESSELQIEKGVPGLLTLALTLRNRAPYAQAHPALELTLTDSEDRAIARRVLMPADYLGERLSREPVFPAASEHAVKLNLDTTTLRAAGYRVYLFYP